MEKNKVENIEFDGNHFESILNVDSLAVGLECPVCLLLPGDKIYQCKLGHLVCESCYKGLNFTVSTKYGVLQKMC